MQNTKKNSWSILNFYLDSKFYFFLFNPCLKEKKESNWNQFLIMAHITRGRSNLFYKFSILYWLVFYYFPGVITIKKVFNYLNYFR